MKLLPLLKATLQGGLKVCFGLVAATMLCFLSWWGYQSVKEGPLRTPKQWEPFSEFNEKLKTRYEGGEVYYQYSMTLPEDLQDLGNDESLGVSLIFFDADGFRVGSSQRLPAFIRHNDGAPKTLESNGSFHMDRDSYARALKWAREF